MGRLIIIASLSGFTLAYYLFTSSYHLPQRKIGVCRQVRHLQAYKFIDGQPVLDLR